MQAVQGALTTISVFAFSGLKLPAVSEDNSLMVIHLHQKWLSLTPQMVIHLHQNGYPPTTKMVIADSTNSYPSTPKWLSLTP
jgi:hypothetical protein